MRRRCVFTTHTPVEAGHDQFDRELVVEVLGEESADALEALGCSPDGRLNMTLLGLTLSRFANGVAMRHGEVSRSMFPGFPIAAITNGVHAQTWTSAPFRELFDERLPRWRWEADSLRHAVGIPTAEIQRAHESAKGALFAEVEKRTGRVLAPDALTLGFARRATPYKRAALLFDELEQLKQVAARSGAMQLVFAGKAHPRDEGGQAVIRRIFEASRELGDDLPVVYLEGYDMELGGLLTSGVDVWLNTPEKPREASGTSGMKAALNGVPSLSSLDGWWIEGHVEGVTGWSFGRGDGRAPGSRERGRGPASRSREQDRAPLPRRSGGLRRGPAVRDRLERLVLQRPTHGPAVRPKLLPPRLRSLTVRPRSPFLTVSWSQSGSVLARTALGWRMSEAVWPGRAFPLGASWDDEGVNFALDSPRRELRGALPLR